MPVIECVVDGASRGQGQAEGGDGACAVVVYRNRKKVAQFSRPLGKCTNNEAEYEAVIAALLICAMGELEDPVIYSDSAVVVNQVNGDWQCKSENLIPRLMTVRILSESMKFRIKQVPRKQVHEADTLVNICLDQLSDELKNTAIKSKTS